VKPNERLVADISVIIPAYQAQATIERALISIAKQTTKPAEIIVVDDGSNDNTSKIVETFSDKLSCTDLRIFQQSNKGAGAARNKALSEARCEFIAFLDADDEWLPEKLEISLDHLCSGNHLLVAHNGWVEEDGKETYLDIATRFHAAGDRIFHGLYRRGFISTSSVIAKREAILAVGGFDETLAVGQDFDLWLKLLDKPGASFDIFDQPLTRYHITPGSITSQVAKRLSCTLEIATRHAPALARHKGSTTISLWFRIIAIHGEAIRSYTKRGTLTSCIGILVSLIYHLTRVSLSMISSAIINNNKHSSEPKISASIHCLLWAWVCLVPIGYLYQFHDLMILTLNILGLK
jgi:teichuronic acid biosynthesis glycosyltransferase TuaG